MYTNVCTLVCTYSSPVCLFPRDQFHFTCVISPVRGFSGIGSEYQFISFVLPFQLHEIRDAKKVTTLRPSVN